VLAASAVASVTVNHFVPGVWYIAAGALAGLATALWQGKAKEQAA